MDVNNTLTSFDISCFKSEISALNTHEIEGGVICLSNEHTIHLLPI